MLPDRASFRLAALFAGAALLGAAPLPLLAADDPPPSASRAASTSPLTAAREHIAAKRWPAAIAELKRVNAQSDADWNNLMGYALRKQATPDLAGAELHYNEALRINPKHLGALEYSGELYLMKGDGPRADERLAALAKACNNCEEYRDLKGATERYKAAGNRYLPQ
jgi:tetratricopeptide (TPR) repeat protein